jgi:hypothetical protein
MGLPDTVRAALSLESLRDRLAAAENVAALAVDHLRNCSDPDLLEAVREWSSATGFQPPASPDEVEEASLEMRSGK